MSEAGVEGEEAGVNVSREGEVKEEAIKSIVSEKEVYTTALSRDIIVESV